VSTAGEPTRASPTSADGAGRHCVTCSDEAVRTRVVTVDRELGLATCVTLEEPSSAEEVAIDLVEPVRTGDTLLVHARVALANLGAEAPASSSGGAA
jgi:hypothetical protein